MIPVVAECDDSYLNEVRRMQVEAGAIGLCTATVWEADVMVRGGIDDVLIANEVVGREKIARLAELGRRSPR